MPATGKDMNVGDITQIDLPTGRISGLVDYRVIKTKVLHPHHKPLRRPAFLTGWAVM
jgi:hypothetical protein